MLKMRRILATASVIALLAKLPLRISLIAALYLMGLATAVQATTGPIDHWSFDTNTISGATVSDVTGNGKNGTLVGSPASITGVFGQALQFNGTNNYFVTTSANGAYGFQGSGTLAMWLKYTSGTVIASYLKSSQEG
jgi:hypothetical protein